jgi:hypothetical protein
VAELLFGLIIILGPDQQALQGAQIMLQYLVQIGYLQNQGFVYGLA